MLKATHDFQGLLTAGTLMAMDTGVIGGTAGNKYQVQLPKTYYMELSPGDRDGVRTYEMGFGATENAGDDEITILFQ